MTGTHVCSCGRRISNNALARASHRRGYHCFLETYWRTPDNVTFWAEVKAGRKVGDLAYWMTRHLAHAARRLKGPIIYLNVKE